MSKVCQKHIRGRGLVAKHAHGQLFCRLSGGFTEAVPCTFCCSSHSSMRGDCRQSDCDIDDAELGVSGVRARDNDATEAFDAIAEEIKQASRARMLVHRPFASCVPWRTARFFAQAMHPGFCGAWSMLSRPGSTADRRLPQSVI